MTMRNYTFRENRRCTFCETRQGAEAFQRTGMWLGGNARRFRTVDCTWMGLSTNVIDESGAEGEHQLDAP
jgi:hypothetical protein